MTRITSQWVRDQLNQMEGFYAGSKQVFLMLARILEEEQKAAEAKNEGTQDGNQ